MKSKKYINVILVFNSIEYSGAELMFFNAYNDFKKKGFNLIFLSTGLHEGELFKTLIEREIDCHHIVGKNKFNLLWKYLKLIRHLEVEVVHIQKEKAFFYFALLSKLAGVKNVIRTVHSTYLNNPVKRIIYRFLSGHLLNVKFTSIGVGVQQHELKKFNNETILIPNWYDDSVFNNKKIDENIIKSLSLNKADKVIISVGSCIELKNHKDIIFALDIIKNIYDYKVKYIHIGTGKELESEQKLAGSLGLDKDVFFIEKTSKVSEYLKISSIFIMPSYNEGLPIAAIEAMASETQVIFYNSPGLRDLLSRDRVRNYLIDRNPGVLAKKIVELFEMNIEQKSEIVKLNKEFVENNFSKSKAVVRFVSLYKGRSFEKNN